MNNWCSFHETELSNCIHLVGPHTGPPFISNVINAAHLQRQREFSEKTFGPGNRTSGVIKHIRKELKEIEKDPSDIYEWIDVIILALDGAWRAGWQPQQIIDALIEKQGINEQREWPDWRQFTNGEAIEHVRDKIPDHRNEVYHSECDHENGVRKCFW